MRITAPSSSAQYSGSREQHSIDEAQEVKVLNGIGRITSSGTTVHGHGTEFMSQLSVGDALMIVHPGSLAEETKVVRMVLSNVSLGLSSAFSSDLISTATFRYIKAPKDEISEEEAAKKEIQKMHKSEEAAFGTYTVNLHIIL